MLPAARHPHQVPRLRVRPQRAGGLLRWPASTRLTREVPRMPADEAAARAKRDAARAKRDAARAKRDAARAKRDLVRRGYDVISRTYRTDDGAAHPSSDEDPGRYRPW